jgi:hypothetical protein
MSKYTCEYYSYGYIITLDDKKMSGPYVIEKLEKLEEQNKEMLRLLKYYNNELCKNLCYERDNCHTTCTVKSDFDNTIERILKYEYK